ncbi:MAG: HDIG domain-containing metalloprotein [Spirochaetota bacterium]
MAKNGRTTHRRFDPIRYYKYALVIVLFLATLILLARGYAGARANFKPGDTAPENIVASKTIRFENRRETEKRRELIINNFRPVFEVRAHIVKASMSNVRAVFTALEKAEKSEQSLAESYRTFLTDTQIRIGFEAFKNLILYSKASRYEEKTIAILARLYDRGVIARANLADATILKMRNGITLYRNTDKEISTTTVDVDAINFLEDTVRDMRAIVLSQFDFLPSDKIAALAELSSSLLRPTIIYDDVLTERKLTELLEKTKPVMDVYKRGYVIVAKGDVITEEKIALLSALAKDLAYYNLRLIVLDSAFLAIFVILAVLYLTRYVSSILTDVKEFTLLAVEYLVIAISAHLMHYQFVPTLVSREAVSVPMYLIAWVPLFSVMNVLILGKRPAFFMAFIGSFLAVAVTYGTVFDLFILLCASVAAILITENLTKRNEILTGGLAVGLILAAGCVIDGLRNEVTLAVTAAEAVIAVIIGIAQGIIAAGLLSGLEHMLGTATVFRLLELSDLNAPLLRQLQITAPGTYHHSFTLSSMVEAACERIHANSLLARVGAYYHDIGKMENPVYFIENVTPRENRHRNIKPSLSATIIKSHVRIGVELAKANDLPEKIIDFIKEHHGTSLIKYFYNQALKHGGTIDKDFYQYAGPKPQTRESAVLMIADSVEAASRTIPNPTGEKILELVRAIINDKIRDKELDESGLTLKDLAHIEDTFVNEIMSSLHGRIVYPNAEEIARREEENAPVPRSPSTTVP